jgi:hypothetical protein
MVSSIVSIASRNAGPQLSLNIFHVDCRKLDVGVEDVQIVLFFVNSANAAPIHQWQHCYAKQLEPMRQVSGAARQMLIAAAPILGRSRGMLNLKPRDSFGIHRSWNYVIWRKSATCPRRFYRLDSGPKDCKIAGTRRWRGKQNIVTARPVFRSMWRAGRCTRCFKDTCVWRPYISANLDVIKP